MFGASILAVHWFRAKSFAGRWEQLIFFFLAVGFHQMKTE